MSSNKIIYPIILIIFSVIINACREKSNSEGTLNSQDNGKIVFNQTKKILGNNVKFAYKGKFDTDSVIEVAAGVEIQNSKEWGIKFTLLKNRANNLYVYYQTDLLNGSFKECLVKKIKLPSYNYELIYYNSQDYFLGSGGGEVYSYIINFNSKQTYYAHLTTEHGKGISLYISGNAEDAKDIKNFFINSFKNEYPSIKIVSKDIELKY